jgi:hypothetical protein
MLLVALYFRNFREFWASDDPIVGGFLVSWVWAFNDPSWVTLGIFPSPTLVEVLDVLGDDFRVAGPCFFDKSIGVSSFVSGHFQRFGTLLDPYFRPFLDPYFRPFLDPYFGSEFCPFFGRLKNAFSGF